QLGPLTLAATQNGIDESRCAGLFQQPRRCDRFSDGGMLGNLCIYELTQADDGQGADLRLQRLIRSTEQSAEQCIETDVPTDTVVAERAEKAALLPGCRAFVSERSVE